MANIDCYGNSTPQGPNYNITDKFSYSSVPKWKFGSGPRDAGDSKPKYEHYLRSDMDVLYMLFSSILVKLIKIEDIILEMRELVENQEYKFCYSVHRRPEKL